MTSKKQPAIAGLPVHYSRVEAARMLGLTTKTLANWASLGRGPQTTRFGGKVRYLEADLQAYVNAERARAITERPVA